MKIKNLLKFVFILFIINACKNEVDSSLIEKINGLFYIKNELFTGVSACKYTEGGYRFQKEIKNGKLNGKSILYFSNGQIKFSCNFKDGSPNGLCEAYYSNSQLMFKGEFSDSTKTGIWEYFNETGSKLFKANYLNGKISGEYNEWYANGKNRIKGEFNSGQKIGKWLFSYENGNKSIEGIYKDNLKNENWSIYNEIGQQELILKFKNGCLNLDSWYFVQKNNKEEIKKIIALFGNAVPTIISNLLYANYTDWGNESRFVCFDPIDNLVSYKDHVDENSYFNELKLKQLPSYELGEKPILYRTILIYKSKTELNIEKREAINYEPDPQYVYDIPQNIRYKSNCTMLGYMEKEGGGPMFTEGYTFVEPLVIEVNNKIIVQEIDLLKIVKDILTTKEKFINPNFETNYIKEL